MNIIAYATLVGAVVGALGTGIGAITVFFIKIKGKQISAVLMGLSAGIMLSVVAFDMLPESVEAAGLGMALIWFAVGGAALFLVNKIMPHHDIGVGDDAKLVSELKEKRLVRSGLLLAIGIAVHNLPEGFALGSGLVSVSGFGIGLALLLFVHNIPEGMGLAIPLKLGGVKYGRILSVAMLAALPMAVGAFLGALMGNISSAVLGGSVAFGGGAMLYLTFSEILPQAAGISSRWTTWAGLAAGAAIGGILVALV
ncbi:MAG: ZIP family metal transporter [Christensenella sp.]